MEVIKMPNATQMKRKKKSDVMEAKVVEMPTSLHVNLKKFKSLDSYDVGDDCQIALMGKVTRKSKDEYSHDLTIEIQSIDKLSEEEEYEDEE
jgi:hypothetical protein